MADAIVCTRAAGMEFLPTPQLPLSRTRPLPAAAEFNTNPAAQMVRELMREAKV